MSLKDKMLNNMKKVSGKGNYEKIDYWTLQRDKSNNGSAVIRFIPHKDEESRDDVLSIAMFHRHEFKNKAGKFYIEYCPVDVGRECPVCDANRPVWDDNDKDTARRLVGHRSRKQSFVANVLIVKDPANPENEGKIRMFKFGKSIYQMIVDKMQPKFADEEAANPWDIVEGVNLKLKVYEDEKKQLNYTKSSWTDTIDVSDDVDYSQFTELDFLVAPEKYKAYEDLQKHFERIEGVSAAPKAAKAASYDDDDLPDEKPKKKAAPKMPALSDDDDDVPTPPKDEEDDTPPTKTTKAKPAASDDDDELEAMMAEISKGKK